MKRVLVQKFSWVRRDIIDVTCAGSALFHHYFCGIVGMMSSATLEHFSYHTEHSSKVHIVLQVFRSSCLVCTRPHIKSDLSHLSTLMLSRILQIRPVRAFSAYASLQKSSCAAGTVLNLKIRKNGDEPVALEDSEYPEWLWDTLDKPKMDEQLKEENLMKWRKKQITKTNTAKIKNNNFVSQM